MRCYLFLRVSQQNQCSPPPSVLRMVQRVRNHLRMPGKDCMNGAAQITNTFSVNNSHIENPPLLACSQVIRNEIFYVARPECVQIQYASNCIGSSILRKLKARPLE